MANMLYTPEQFEDKLEQFIQYCDSKQIDPTDYQLSRFFGISLTTLDRYRAGDNEDSVAKDKDKYKGFGAALKKLDAYREDYALRQVSANPKLAGHVAFKLKQAHWGGWTDRQETALSGDIKVQMTTSTDKPFD
jgi:hypothetical protein